MKIKYILCERAWLQCIMGNRKMAENVLKYYWDGIFCNVIVFYCFLELVETPTVFFLKNLILGQCYTFVHQNCATDLCFVSVFPFYQYYSLIGHCSSPLVPFLCCLPLHCTITTVEALWGHHWDVKKVSLFGAGRLQEWFSV